MFLRHDSIHTSDKWAVRGKAEIGEECHQIETQEMRISLKKHRIRVYFRKSPFANKLGESLGEEVLQTEDVLKVTCKLGKCSCHCLLGWIFQFYTIKKNLLRLELLELPA